MLEGWLLRKLIQGDEGNVRQAMDAGNGPPTDAVFESTMTVSLKKVVVYS